MRIVLITKRDRNTTSPRLNEGFLQRLSEYKDIEFYTVEAYVHRRQKILLTPEQVINDYKPDVVICHAHSNVLDGYFKKFENQLKIMVAVDFWKIIKNNKLSGYYNNSFDLTIHRGYYSSVKKVNTETVGLPFSASDKEFYPQDFKLPYIGFAGTCMSPVYSERRRAIHYLDGDGLLVYNRGNRGLIRHNYPRFLRLFQSMLCSAELNTPYGKLFEIMASGSLALIPEFNGKRELFGKDTMVHFKNDCSDIEAKARMILNDHSMRAEMTSKSYKNFRKMHTDNLRLQELYGIIRAKYDGKDVPRRWGI